MMDRQGIAGYSGLQVLLHWTIAALVLFQLVFGESMSTAQRALARGIAVPPTDASLASAHYWVGIAILALVALRIGVRLVQGAPPRSGDGTWLGRLATLAHGLFYVLLVAVPVTGLLAFYVSRSFDDIHSLGKPAFIVLIGLHVLAVLFHQFWLKDGTLRRMLVPGR